MISKYFIIIGISLLAIGGILNGFEYKSWGLASAAICLGIANLILFLR